MKYLVRSQEKYIVLWTVEAEDEAHAQRQVESGDGEEISKVYDGLEVQEVLPSS